MLSLINRKLRQKCKFEFKLSTEILRCNCFQFKCAVWSGCIKHYPLNHYKEHSQCVRCDAAPLFS